MRRPASLAQLELPLAASSPTTSPEPSSAPEPTPTPARLCGRCGWYCALAEPCPVCHTPPEHA